MVAVELIVRDLAFGLMLGCVFSVVAHGLNIIWGIVKVVNVAHGEFIMLGAYGAYFLNLSIGALTSGLSPRNRLRKYAPYAPSMMNSPWATFTTFAMPQIRLSPWAISAKTQPRRIPRTMPKISCATTADGSAMGPSDGPA